MTVNTWHQDKTPSSWERVLVLLKDFENHVQQIKKEKKDSPVSIETFLYTFRPSGAWHFTKTLLMCFYKNFTHPQNIWILDKFLSEGFLPRWKKLAQAG